MNNRPVVSSTNTPPPTPARPCRIWVLEDHNAIRQLLADFVLVQPGYKVAGASARAEPLLEACKKSEVDLVLLDLMLEGIGGLKVLEELSAFTPRPRVVVFSATVTMHTVQAALSWGVSGYVEKAAPLEQLQSAIARAATGGVFFSERVSTMVRRLIEQRSQGTEGPNTLTPRELRVLELVARGMSAKQLAKEMNLSEPAIYKVKQAISAKLHAWSDQELTLNALRMGLIGSLDEDPAAPPA